ncbi:MAG: 50S ribosomal protein L9 [Burkholderiales bacterium]|nr:50S ribosomal protein L9 [Burkholderiales bacterium]
MQVILLDKVGKLGNLGDVVKVKDGYARNFLIPTRAARRATESAIKEFEVKRAELEKAAADKLAAANALGEKMSGRTVHITQKAGVDGRLFGSVTNADIADALTRIDFKVLKSQVRMPSGPLKTVGEHTVSVAPHTDVVVEVKVVILGETD